MKSTIRIGFDAKRLVRNGTGFGNYGRTLVGDLSAAVPSGWSLTSPDYMRQSQQMLKEEGKSL